MKLGLNIGFLTSANPDPVPLAVEAERLGYDSVWTAEAWGSDAVTPAAWILAQTTRLHVGTGIIQMPARAPAAAAVIHTDFERGFIRAEVIGYEDFVTLGGEAGARDAGRMRVEGRDYAVEDGDVIYFRFNV